MYPIGLTTIQEYLKRYGYSVRIINIALKMLKNPKFNPEKLIAELNPKAFGIDLHWLPHCHGSLEIAKLVKKYHPNTPVIFGGLSSSYFHRDLVQYNQVDYVLRGDTTEEPLRQLMDCITQNKEPKDVPNLTWQKDGQVIENPFSHVPVDIDDICIDYRQVFKAVVRYMDLEGHLPFANWMEYPITAVMTCRGCNHPCVICGGSAYSFKHFYNRPKTAYRSPEKVAADIKNIAKTTRGPIFVLGDLRHAGDNFADKILELCKPMKIKNQMAFELFTPAGPDYFKKLNETFKHYSIEMSIESHDEKVRKASGKYYNNQEIEETIDAALSNGCERFDVFFLTGLPKQTLESAVETVDYCDLMYKRFNNDKRLLFFISPVGPFLDPGSAAFEHPEKHGYKILFKDLESHRQSLLQPSWKYTLNYETKWMDRNQLVEATYQAALGLNDLKRKCGVIKKDIADRTEKRIEQAMELMSVIDEIMAIKDTATREVVLKELKEKVKGSSISTVCEKKELEWPVKRAYNFRITGILKTILRPSAKAKEAKKELTGV